MFNIGIIQFSFFSILLLTNTFVQAQIISDNLRPDVVLQNNQFSNPELFDKIVEVEDALKADQYEVALKLSIECLEILVQQPVISRKSVNNG